MDVLLERCAGIDIGKNEVVACVRTPGPGGKGRMKRTRTFLSFTGDVEAMADWFAAEGVTDVVMEATGSYWKPVWYVLEERAFELKLVNAAHVKILPGRKSDVLDAEWLAELLEHGLLRGSFVPPPAIRELRDLTRYRKRLVQAHNSECQRIQKTLEDAGIKLDSVASDVLGVSGRLMLAALVAGERDPEVLAEMAKQRLRSKIPELRRALVGRFRDHHALLIGLCLEHIAHLEAAVAKLDERVDALFAANQSEAGVPFAQARDRLDTITGIGKRAAECIIAEIGVDMGRFPTAGHLASWAGMAPGNNITGAPLGQDHQGRRLAARHPFAVRLGRRPHPRHLPLGPVLAPGPADRQEEGGRRRRPLHPGHLLVPAHRRLRLRGSGRRLLRSASRPRPRPGPPRRTTPAPGLPGRPPQGRRVNHQGFSS